jgi:hypothetical protein
LRAFVCVDSNASAGGGFSLSIYIFSYDEEREREREKCSLENGKMLLEYDVLVLAGASKKRDDRFLLPVFFKCCVPIRALSF